MYVHGRAQPSAHGNLAGTPAEPRQTLVISTFNPVADDQFSGEVAPRERVHSAARSGQLVAYIGLEGHVPHAQGTVPIAGRWAKPSPHGNLAGPPGVPRYSL